jgi:hypothetical protein
MRREEDSRRSQQKLHKTGRMVSEATIKRRLGVKSEYAFDGENASRNCHCAESLQVATVLAFLGRLSP